MNHAWTPAQCEADFSDAPISFHDALRMCAHTLIEDDAAVERLAKGQIAEAISVDAALSSEYQKDTQAYSQRVAFFHSDGKTAALANASADEPTLYRAEKVFFLDRDDA